MTEVAPNEYLSGTISEGDPEMVYLRLVEQGQDVVSRTGWLLGKLADAVQTSYGEDRLGRYAHDIGAAYKTVLNARTVVRAWPEESRPMGLSFGVAKALAAQPDRSQLIREFPQMTVKEARDLIAKRIEATVPPAEQPDWQDDTPSTVRKFSAVLREYADKISPEHYAQLLDRAANKARKQAKQLAMEGEQNEADHSDSQ